MMLRDQTRVEGFKAIIKRTSPCRTAILDIRVAPVHTVAPEILKGRDLGETPPLNIAVVWAVAPLTLAADVDTPGVSLGGAPGLHIVHQGTLFISNILEYGL